MNRNCCFKQFGLLMFIVLVFLVPCTAELCAQGQYKPVTDADVVSLKLNHYFTADKKHHDADFQWTFTKSEFVLKNEKGSIPADLIEKLFPADTKVDEIRGTWKLDSKDGQRLILTDIKAGKTPGKKEVGLSIYRTAPTVVRIGEPQYVFAIQSTK